MNKDHFIRHLSSKIEEIVLLINTEMIMDGDTEDESRAVCLINRIFDFEHCVTSVEQGDMKSS